MSNTSVPIELSSTPGIVDNSNATAITIDSNENVGIGVVPETWLSNYDALQIGASGSIFGIASGNENISIASNAYLATDGNHKYIATNEASQYLQSAGVHYFRNAASGTADTNITWNDRMVIDLSGNVGIGTSSPSGNYTKTLHIHGSGTGASLHLTDPTSGATASDGLEVIQYGTDGYIWERDAGSLRFGTNSAERMRIDSSGNVGIGATSPQHHLDIEATTPTIL